MFVNFSFSERGRVYVFGNNEWGQLGLGHTKASNKPSFIKGKWTLKITTICMIEILLSYINKLAYTFLIFYNSNFLF